MTVSIETLFDRSAALYAPLDGDTIVAAALTALQSRIDACYDALQDEAVGQVPLPPTPSHSLPLP